MNQRVVPGRRTPGHLWVVGILSLLWNAFGAFDYLATQLRLQSYLSQFTPDQRSYFEAFPSWAISAWALGVWGAFVGSILLLLRSRWAVWAFGISLAGLAVSTVYQFVLTEGLKVMGEVGIGITSLVWVIEIALLWYSVRQRKNRVLA